MHTQASNVLQPTLFPNYRGLTAVSISSGGDARKIWYSGQVTVIRPSINQVLFIQLIPHFNLLFSTTPTKFMSVVRNLILF
jgi:hypothetical protein